jgi:hypothetical protein
MAALPCVILHTLSQNLCANLCSVPGFAATLPRTPVARTPGRGSSASLSGRASTPWAASGDGAPMRGGNSGNRVAHVPQGACFNTLRGLGRWSTDARARCGARCGGRRSGRTTTGRSLPVRLSNHEHRHLRRCSHGEHATPSFRVRVQRERAHVERLYVKPPNSLSKNAESSYLVLDHIDSKKVHAGRGSFDLFMKHLIRTPACLLSLMVWPRPRMPICKSYCFTICSMALPSSFTASVWHGADNGQHRAMEHRCQAATAMEPT